MFSPFNELDDERRKRDKELLSKVGDLGTSMVKTPLNFQTLYQEQEDRKRKISADAEELARKRAEDTRETEKHSQDMDKSKFDLEQGKEKASTAKSDKTIADLVAGLMTSPEDDEASIIDHAKSLGHDEVTVAGEIAKQKAEMARSGLKGRELDIKQQTADARMKDSDTRSKKEAARAKASANAYKPKDRPLTATEAKDFVNLEKDLGRLETLKNYRQHGNVETGPIVGLAHIVRRKLRIEDPAVAIMRRDVQNELNTYLKETSGATVTPEEFGRLAEILPSLSDDEDVFDAILEAAERSRVKEWNDTLRTMQDIGRYTGDLKPKGAGGKPITPVKPSTPKEQSEKRAAAKKAAAEYMKRLGING